MKELIHNDGTAKVDDEDFERASNHSWFIFRPKNKYCYLATNVPDPNRPGKRTILFLHRLVMNATSNQRVMFKSSDTFDVRKKNLVVREKTSKYNGVSLHPSGLWAAMGYDDGKVTYIGVYKTEAEANDARRKYEGERR